MAGARADAARPGADAARPDADASGPDAAADVPGCLSCDLTAGRRELPGGVIHDDGLWRVEHCLGLLGVGTLIVRPIRHVTRVSELGADEAARLGPLLRDAAAVVDELLNPEQVYVCLWSHAGGQPGHVHYVVQPVSTELAARYGARGPDLQAAMFGAREPLPPDAVRAIAERYRAWFAARSGQRATVCPNGNDGDE